MASFKLYLDTRSPRKDGSCPLKIAVNHKGRFLINLKIYTTPEMFVGGEVLVPDNKYRQKNINDTISQWMVSTENTINRLSLLGRLPQMTDEELKAAILGEQPKEESESPVLFKDRYDAYTAAITKKSTLSTYNNMYVHLCRFANIDLLTFDQMNYH